MKILYLMSEFPYPPRGGGALRIMGLVTGAARAGHDIHILSFGVELNHTPLHDLCASIDIIPSPQRSKTDRIKTLLLSSHADMERRNWSDDFLKALERKLQQNHFDIVQFQSLEMGIYLRHVRHIQPEAKLIYDAYNAEAELQHMVYETDRQNLKMLPMAFYSWMQWKRLSTFERQLCQNADAVIAVSESDQRTLQKIAGKTPVYMVNNGIDVSDYAAVPDVKLDLQPPALIFTGIMDYRPNVDAAVWFAEDIFPKIHHPGVHLYLVGNRPDTRVVSLAERDNITVTGFVEDVLPYLHQAAVFVVPLRVGSGTRLKLLQAMSAGCAIVSTRVGAMGLNVQNGREMLLADDADAFARQVMTLLENPEKREQLAQAGYEFVRAHFDWSMIVPRLLAVYEKLIPYG